MKYYFLNDRPIISRICVISSSRFTINRCICAFKEIVTSDGLMNRVKSTSSLGSKSAYSPFFWFLLVWIGGIRFAMLIPISASIISLAKEYEDKFRLHTSDAIILASIVSYLEQTKPSTSFFLNKNVKDFYIPEIVDKLEKYKCEYI